jgi:N-acetylmuramic acid 6-phosphate etherase
MSDERLRNLREVITEARNPKSENLDRLSAPELFDLINSEDHTVADAVLKEKGAIVRAIEMAAETFRESGRLFYMGAGTSGRLGVVDASECPPTFGVSPEMVQGIIAGGKESVFLSREGAEDDTESAGRDLAERGVGENDMLIGIAACSSTPYVLAGLKEAKARGAKTAFLICNPPGEIDLEVDVIIAPVVGPEILTGSTRMKAGTATKMVLNTITTGAMVLIGKTYGNLMVDLRPTSEKLKCRSLRIIMAATGASEDEAETLIEDSGGELKVAIVMKKLGVDRDEAKRRLSSAGGFVRNALESAE